MRFCGPVFRYYLGADGAGDGNRTHVSSLGSCSSTIELHPHSNETPLVYLQSA
jgi:hypothetical protein